MNILNYTLKFVPHLLSKVVRFSLQEKDIALLSDKVVIHYKPVSRTDIEERQIKLTLSACTYSIDDFNAKVKAVVLESRKDWYDPRLENERW